MATDIGEKLGKLIADVGEGTLESSCVVDQVYAKYQELREDLNHPEGGQAHYLRDSLFHELSPIMGMYGRALLTPMGSEIRHAAGDVAEHISQGVYERAPFEFGDLKGSGHPSATDDGATIYDRAPNVHRLGHEELRAKGDLRRLGFGHNASEADVRHGLGG